MKQIPSLSNTRPLRKGEVLESTDLFSSPLGKIRQTRLWGQTLVNAGRHFRPLPEQLRDARLLKENELICAGDLYLRGDIVETANTVGFQVPADCDKYYRPIMKINYTTIGFLVNDEKSFNAVMAFFNARGQRIHPEYKQTFEDARKSYGGHANGINLLSTRDEWITLGAANNLSGVTTYPVIDLRVVMTIKVVLSPEYTAEISAGKKTVTVGCQTFDAAVVLKLAKLLQ